MFINYTYNYNYFNIFTNYLVVIKFIFNIFGECLVFAGGNMIFWGLHVSNCEQEMKSSCCRPISSMHFYVFYHSDAS